MAGPAQAGLLALLRPRPHAPSSQLQDGGPEEDEEPRGGQGWWGPVHLQGPLRGLGEPLTSPVPPWRLKHESPVSATFKSEVP